MSHSRWNLLPAMPFDKLTTSHERSVSRTRDSVDSPSRLSPLLLQLLHNRGLRDPQQVQSFLAADESSSGDPYLLPDMHQAIARLYKALLSNERVAVYGDFDTDGITSTALLVQGLALLNCAATPYIPHRVTEGYGLQPAALDKLKSQGVSVVLTVDCGVTAVDEVRRAKKLGLDVIVTDHHTPTDELPQAKAVVNPKLPGSRYPFPELAGVGVAFKLLQALFRGMGKEQMLDGLFDLVALGTVADMVPLLGENRYMVKRGLAVLSNAPRLGIREMLAQAGSSTMGLDAERISFMIAPRLNAAGRLEHAMGSYKLLTTDSPEEARELASWLEQKNAERQRLTGKVLAEAREQVLTQLDSPILIAGGEDFPAGIIGLVAGKLTDEFYRPAIVLRTGEQFCGGSCRSIPEFDIIRALNRCQSLRQARAAPLLTRFGGHSQAAGLSLRSEDLPRLKETIIGIAAAELAGVDLRPRIDIDAEVALAGMGAETYTAIQRLAPFGQGNPAPTFLSRTVNVLECRTMGNGGDHLRLKLKQPIQPEPETGVLQYEPVWDAVAFGLGSRRSEMSSSIDMVYSLEMDRWNGQERLRLNVVDFAPAGIR